MYRKVLLNWMAFVISCFIVLKKIIGSNEALSFSIKNSFQNIMELLFKLGVWKASSGYYTVARRYEFYFRVAKQYFTNERSE